MREIDEVRPSEATAPGVRVEVVVDRVERRPPDRADCRRRSRPRGRAARAGPSCAPRWRAAGPTTPSRRARLVCPRVRARFRSAPAGLCSRTIPRSAPATPAAASVASSPSTGTRSSPIPARRSPRAPSSPGGARAPRGSAACSRSSAEREKIPLDVPWGKLKAAQRRAVLDGEGDWHQRQVPGCEGLVRVARGPHLQDARARAALAVPRVHGVRRVQGLAPQRHRARLPGGGPEPRRLARADRRRRPCPRQRLRRARSAGQAGTGAARVAPGLPRRGGARVPHARPAGPHALRGRGAARGAHHRPRRSAHRDALRPRRAHGGPARDRRARAGARHARAVAGRQHGHGRRARGAGRTDVRSRARDGPGRRAARRTHPVRRHAGRAGQAHRPADRQGMGRFARAVAGEARGQRLARDPRARATHNLQDVDVRIPLRRALRGDRAERIGQIHARSRRALPGCRRGPSGISPSTSPARTTRLEGIGRTCPRGPRRPIASRAARREATPRRTSKRGIASAPGSRPSRRPARRGLTAGPLLIQRARWALRGVRWRGLRDRRDAVSRRRAAALPRVPGLALQARGARGHPPRASRSPTSWA